MDFQGRSIICLDRELQYQSTIGLDVNAIDFSKIDGGFLLLNLSPNKKQGRVLHIDMNGKNINNFIEASTDLDLILSSKYFSEDGKGNVFFSDPMTNNIYTWEKNSLVPSFRLSYGTEEKDNEKSSEIFKAQKVNTINSLITTKHVITFFIANRFILTSIYGKSGGGTKSGLVNTHIAYPFTPKIVSGNSLIDVCEKIDNGATQSKLLVYHLRDDRQTN